MVSEMQRTVQEFFKIHPSVDHCVIVTKTHNNTTAQRNPPPKKKQKTKKNKTKQKKKTRRKMQCQDNFFGMEFFVLNRQNFR